MTAESPLPVDRGTDALLASIHRRGWSVDDLTASQAWQSFVDFAAVPFDVPDEPDSDGLLYQVGVHDFSGGRAFHLDPVRQFARYGHDEYAQIHLEMRFAAVPALVALGGHTEWWFTGADTSLDRWAAAIGRRPEWSVLSGLTPLSVEIRQDET